MRGKQSVASAGKQRLRRSEASALQRVSDDDEVLNVKSQTHIHIHTLETQTHTHFCIHLYNVLQTYVACGGLCCSSWLRPSRLSQTTNLPQQPRLSQMLNGILGQQ